MHNVESSIPNPQLGLNRLASQRTEAPADHWKIKAAAQKSDQLVKADKFQDKN
jgi:hypothetical protein